MKELVDWVIRGKKQACGFVHVLLDIAALYWPYNIITLSNARSIHKNNVKK